MIGEYFQGQTKWALVAPDHKADLIFYRKGGIEGTFTGPHHAWNLEGVSHHLPSVQSPLLAAPILDKVRLKMLNPQLK